MTNRLSPFVPMAVALSLGTVTQSSRAAEPRQPAAPQSVVIKGNASLYDARRYDTASKIVVTREEILRQGDSSLIDVLKRQPGITVNPSPRRGEGPIALRGLGSGYTQVLLNGEPAPAGFAIESLSPELVERIEIMRAATADMSSQAIAGTVNIVLKKSIRAGQRDLRISQLNGTGYFTTESTAQISDKMGALAYSVAGNVLYHGFDETHLKTETGAGPDGLPSSAREFTHRQKGNHRNFTVTPRLEWSLGDSDSLSSQSLIVSSRVRYRDRDNWDATLGPAPAIVDYGRQGGSQRYGLRSDLTWLRKLGDGATFESKLGVNVTDIRRYYEEQGRDQVGVTVLDSATTFDTRDGGASLTGKYRAPLGTDHMLTVGWDAGSQRRSEKRRQGAMALAELEQGSVEERHLARVTRLAVFIQDDWTLNPQWSTYLGVRWEGLDMGSDSNAGARGRGRFSVVSPTLQALWKIPGGEASQVRFSANRTYKAPVAEQLVARRTVVTNNSAATPDTIGNPQLRPELAWGADLAYERYFGSDGAMVSVGTYLRRIEDVTRRDVALIDNRWTSRPVNDGQALARGIEIDTKFRLRPWQQGPQFDVRANLTRNFSTVAAVPGPHNRLAGQVPLSATLAVDHQVSERLKGGAALTYKAGGPVRVSERMSTDASSRRGLDLYAVWRSGPTVQWRLGVSNLLSNSISSTEQYRNDAGSQRATAHAPSPVIARASVELGF